MIRRNPMMVADVILFLVLVLECLYLSCHWQCLVFEYPEYSVGSMDDVYIVSRQ